MSMLYLIGLAHRAQSRKSDLKQTEAQQAFEHTLRRIIKDVRPTCIAEEDSEEALCERHENSIARAVAYEYGIEHRFCDPTREQRHAIGYRDGQSLEIEIFMKDRVGLSNEEIRLRGRAIEIGRFFPIRERFWLDQLAECRDRDTVFICGDGHIESFGRLLESNGTQCTVVERGIGLTEEDEWFDKAVRYLSEHPELLND
jgi:hypothetical protein